MKAHLLYLTMIFALNAAAALPPCYGGDRDHEGFFTIWHRVNQWPEPYVGLDRQSATSPLAIMCEKGWRLENLLSESHFGSEGELTSAGQVKIRAILATAQPDRRAIYVNRADSSRLTAARLNAVQQYVTRVSPEGQVSSIVETSMIRPEWSAERVDAINRKVLASVPDPKLGAMQDDNPGTGGLTINAGGGGNSGSSGGGGGGSQ
jgi:hypothetical protein